MAHSDKTEHVSQSIMERFSMRTLSKTELTKVARHLSGCCDCQASFVSTLRCQRGDADLSFTLAPEFWIRHDHLDYEQLVNLADDKLEPSDREFIDDHLKVCPPCQEDVRSFLAFRKQIAPEMSVSYSPVDEEPARELTSWANWWRGLSWKPVYSAAVVVVGIALVIAAAFLLSRRTENQQVQQVPTPQVSPASTPSLAINLPPPTVSPKSPTEKPITAEAVVLNDDGRTITVDKSGNVGGMDDVPLATRNEVAQVLLSGRINRPSILRDLSAEDSGLRGGNVGQPFKLIAPGRTVIVSDRPNFKWDRVPGATAYTVYVNDATGQIAARRNALTHDRREWPVSKPLKRGEIYAWVVTAIVNGNEITSPGPSAPEMKFQILSATDFAKLNQLKRVGSHLALGVFYARAGMNAQAELEFQILARKNRRSQALYKLLRKIQF